MPPPKPGPNRQPTPERSMSREQAIAAYLSTPHQVGIGEMPLDLMRRWVDVCQDTSGLTLRQCHLVAEMCVEAAFGVNSNTDLSSDTSARQEVATLLGRADTLIGRVVKTGVQTEPHLFREAALIGSATTVIKEQFCNNPEWVKFALLGYHNSLANAASSAMLAVKNEEPDIESYLYLQTITAILSLNELEKQPDGSLRMKCILPGLARHRLGSGSTDRRFHAMYWDLSGDEMPIPIRFGEDAPEGFLALPRSLLRYQDYGVEHRRGALNDIVDDWLKRGDLNVTTMALMLGSHSSLAVKAQQSGVSAPRKTGKPTATISGVAAPAVRAQLISHIESQLAQRNERPPQPVNYLDYYGSLGPYFPMSAELTGEDGWLSQAITAAEVACLYGGEAVAAPDILRVAADLRQERALVLSANPDRASHFSAAADFRQAQEWLQQIAKHDAVPILKQVEAMLHSLPMSVMATIAQGESTQSAQESLRSYCDSLVKFGGTLVKLQQRPDLLAGSHEVAQIDQLLQQVQTCLLCMSSGLMFIAAPALPRQQGMDGWDITIWADVADVFAEPGEVDEPVRCDLAYSGRLCIATQADPLSIDRGVVTVTGKDLLYAPGRRPVLDVLLGTAELLPDRKTHVRYVAMMKQLSKAADTAMM